MYVSNVSSTVFCGIKRFHKCEKITITTFWVVVLHNSILFHSKSSENYMQM